MMNDDKAAVQIASYASREKLWFGAGPRSPQNPLSWALAMSSLMLDRGTYKQLEDEFPAILQKFVATADVGTEETTEPICIRPDFVIANDGSVLMVECNVDRRLDRGIALGVEEYTVQSSIAAPSHLEGLAKAYSTLLRSDTTTEPRLGVLLEPSRSMYYSQEALFARSLTEAGVASDVIQLDSSGEMQARLPGGFILPEFEGPASEWSTRLGELEHKWRAVGRPRGYDDKALLVRASGMLPGIVPTFGLDQASLAASPWGSRAGLAKAEHPAVLKPAGTTELSTESKGVVISLDCSLDKWRQSVNEALASPTEWVVQPFIEGRRMPITYRNTPLGTTRSAMAHCRLTGYYVRSSFTSNSEYRLAHLIATMGTDREMLLGRTHVIRARRDCAYAVVRCL